MITTFGIERQKAKIFIKQVEKWMNDVQYLDWKFNIYLDETRPIMQIECDGICNVTGKPMKWKSRKWFLTPYMTKSEIIQTAFKAVLTAQEHEVREQFKYCGLSVFDPHYDVDELVKLRANSEVALDEREN